MAIVQFEGGASKDEPIIKYDGPNKPGRPRRKRYAKSQTSGRNRASSKSRRKGRGRRFEQGQYGSRFGRAGFDRGRSQLPPSSPSSPSSPSWWSGVVSAFDKYTGERNQYRNLSEQLTTPIAEDRHNFRPKGTASNYDPMSFEDRVLKAQQSLLDWENSGGNVDAWLQYFGPDALAVAPYNPGGAGEVGTVYNSGGGSFGGGGGGGGGFGGFGFGGGGGSAQDWITRLLGERFWSIPSA